MNNIPRRVLVALGTNMAHRALAGPALLAAALDEMRKSPLVIRALSNIWETAPWPPSDQATFFNAVVAVDWEEHAPQAMFDGLRRIEQKFGRERRERWGPRTLDLDLLDVAGAIGEFGPITLPHPRLAERAFVLAPLAQAAPGWRHPVTGCDAVEMLRTLAPGQLARDLGPFPSN